MVIMFNSPNSANPHAEYVDDEPIVRQVSSSRLVYLLSHKDRMPLLLGHILLLLLWIYFQNKQIGKPKKNKMQITTELSFQPWSSMASGTHNKLPTQWHHPVPLGAALSSLRQRARFSPSLCPGASARAEQAGGGGGRGGGGWELEPGVVEVLMAPYQEGCSLERLALQANRVRVQ